MDVALSHVEYGTADACGGYLDVDGPDGSVRVLITNQPRRVNGGQRAALYVLVTLPTRSAPVNRR